MDCENSSRTLFSTLKKVDVAHATNIPGQKVSQGSYSAFVPAPLPPELELDTAADWGTLGMQTGSSEVGGRRVVGFPILIF